MPSWSEIDAAVPELAAAARARFEAHTHHTLATLRKDGSPRISGTECLFKDGDVWLGSMSGAMKARDLARDGRFSVHSFSEDPPDWGGDARLSGRAVEITEPDGFRRVYGRDGDGAHLFRLDITEVVVVALNDTRTKLVITSWTPERGVKRVER
jgi:hypothetical protein